MCKTIGQLKFNVGDKIKNEIGDTFRVEKKDYPFYNLVLFGNKHAGSYSKKRRLSMRDVEERFKIDD